jgi:glutaredoxin
MNSAINFVGNLVIRPVRFVIGQLILLLDAIFSPRPMIRAATEQNIVDLQTANLSLYEFQTCPFCVKVRRAMKRLNLKIERRDVRGSENFKDQLVNQGGQMQVPCLRIQSDDHVVWLYESDDIIKYLDNHFGAGSRPLNA